MNPIVFGDPLTFHLAPPSGQNFNLAKENIENQVFEIAIKTWGIDIVLVKIDNF